MGRSDDVEEIRVSPDRKTVTYRLDPLVARGFKESCRKVGQSTCSVLEAFEYSFMRAVSAGDYHDPRPLIVNLHMERVVQRIHRIGKERIVEEIPKDLGASDSCFMCGQEAVFHGYLIRCKPQVPAYVCGLHRELLGDLKGFRVDQVKNLRRSWVPPGDRSL